MRCSFKHKLKYVKNIELDQWSIETVLGTVFHECAECVVKKIDFDRDKLAEIVVEKLNEICEEDKKDFDSEKCIARAIELSHDVIPFLDETFPGWELVGCELPLYEPLDFEEVEKWKEYNFKGYIDLVIKATDKRGKTFYWILDWKTTKKPWDKRKLMDPAVTYQLSLYKNFFSKKNDVPLEQIRCGYATVLKNGKPGKVIKLIPVSVGPTTSKRTLTVLNNFVGSMKRGIAIKNKNEFNCRWCEYNGTEHCT